MPQNIHWKYTHTRILSVILIWFVEALFRSLTLLLHIVCTPLFWIAEDYVGTSRSQSVTAEGTLLEACCHDQHIFEHQPTTDQVEGLQTDYVHEYLVNHCSVCKSILLGSLWYSAECRLHNTDKGHWVKSHSLRNHYSLQNALQLRSSSRENQEYCKEYRCFHLDVLWHILHVLLLHRLIFF